MSRKILTFRENATILGAGPAAEATLRQALACAPRLVCADGGANALARWGETPEAIVGDLDSLADAAGWRARLGSRLIRVAEQDTTDFEKCLARIDAPAMIGVGFIGGRLDHGLAALHALVADPRPIALLSEADVVFAPRRPVCLDLPPGDRVSLLSMRPVTARATGLRWPAAGLRLDAGRRIGASNESVEGAATIRFDEPGGLVILDARRLDIALAALSAAVN